MSAVDNAGDAFAFGLGDFRGHQIHVVHDVGARGAAATAATATRRGRRQSIRGSSGGRGRRKFRVEIGRQLHVLVEKRGASRQLLGRVVFEDCSDNRALRKYRVLRECTPRDCGCRADSQ